ncbi:Histidine kinase-, DNA gyrase B-, and HSP90-like ATPase [Catalinimonas alkaloidigena]|uniref:histidine kinase n=2 Tax=Catalinimonas alkaloidigena TaxID=1075417 RepID=A0A1G9H4W5_9BACT|nr:Histidine kinase-, DNA gyrase B-, and HSP90-like ATPase [Catalinimonas alkaloidigena]
MMTVLTVFIFLFVIFYQKRTIRYQLELQRLQAEKQREMLQAVLDAQEAERHRLAEDLHDSVGQVLSAMRLNLHRLLTMAERNEVPPPQRDLLCDTRQLADDCINEIRMIVRNILPPLLSDFGLFEAVREFAQKQESLTGMPVRLRLEGSTQRYAAHLEVMVYRITQELFNNALKHAQATELHLTLAAEPTRILLTFEDNGIGFERDKVVAGFGLKNLESRVQLLNGSMHLDSAPQRGTRVEIIIPTPTDSSLNSSK